MQHPVMRDKLPMFDTSNEEDFAKIPLRPDATPKYIQQYKLSKEEIDALDVEIREMLANGRIEPSVSPWNSPLVFCRKPGSGKIRFVVDLREANKMILNDSYPMPVADLVFHYYAKPREPDFFNRGRTQRIPQHRHTPI